MDKVREPAIQLNHVTAGYGGKNILNDVTLHVPSGELIGISGPNGAGKTTFLRVISGLLVASRGDVLLFNRSLNDARRRRWARRQVGYVAQEQASVSFPIDVFDAILLGRLGRSFGKWKRAGSVDRHVVNEWIVRVQLEHKKRNDITELSGGERQRVALARALAGEPQLLILDEPTTYLDVDARKDLMQLVLELHNELRLTTLFVTHEPQLLSDYANRHITINEGRIDG